MEEEDDEGGIVFEIEKKGDDDTEPEGSYDSVDTFDMECQPVELRLSNNDTDMLGEMESTLDSDCNDVIEYRIESVLGGV